MVKSGRVAIYYSKKEAMEMKEKLHKLYKGGVYRINKIKVGNHYIYELYGIGVHDALVQLPR